MFESTRRLLLFSCLAVAGLVLSHPTLAASTEEINAKSQQALQTLYGESSAAQDLGADAHGILIFPEITKGGFIVGGEYGEGELQMDGQVQGYYSSASGSIGLQLGLSSRSLVIMFLDEGALSKFLKDDDGWEVGVDADVTVVQIGATGSFDSTTVDKPVVAFNFGEKGLMAGVSIEGTKVSKIEP
ncbi:MAG: YSC84-related protein [Pseudomonadota bacterium]